MRRPYQLRILDLLILTTLVALAIQLWPLMRGLGTQLMLVGWTVLTCVQLLLFRKSWALAPSEGDKGYSAYVIACPACLAPILIWMFIMFAMSLEWLGHSAMLNGLFILPVILVVAWGYSIIAITISFFVSRRIADSNLFLWLRLIAILNLAIVPILITR